MTTSTCIGWSHQVARCRFEYRTYTKCTVYDYRNTSNVHSLMTTNVKEQANSRWTIMHMWNSKLLGGSSIIESLEQDTTRTSPLSQLFVERKVHSQKWPWSWSIGQHTFKRGIFGGGLGLQRSTYRAIANLVSRSCYACILVQHFAQVCIDTGYQDWILGHTISWIQRWPV